MAPTVCPYKTHFLSRLETMSLDLCGFKKPHFARFKIHEDPRARSLTYTYLFSSSYSKEKKLSSKASRILDNYKMECYLYYNGLAVIKRCGFQKSQGEKVVAKKMLMSIILNDHLSLKMMDINIIAAISWSPPSISQLFYPGFFEGCTLFFIFI